MDNQKKQSTSSKYRDLIASKPLDPASLIDKIIHQEEIDKKTWKTTFKSTTVYKNIPPLFTALNEEWYIDDDIRCEPNEDVIKEYNQIMAKYKLESTKAVKVYELLIKRYYIYDSDEEALWFIRCYFYFRKVYLDNFQTWQQQ